MNKTIQLYVYVSLILLQNIKSIESWNPIIDECVPEEHPFYCEPTIDGSIEADQNQVRNDVKQILQIKERQGIIDILTQRNFNHRLAVKEMYFEKHPSGKLLQHHQGDVDNLATYSELLTRLLQPVKEQYVTYLWVAASARPNSIEGMHGTTLFMLMLGGMSNKGLRYLDQAIKTSGDSEVEISLAHQMRTVGRYPEKFISMVMELLKGEREESTEIDPEEYQNDFEKLSNNLAIPKQNRADEDEDFLIELFTKRSFKYLDVLMREQPFARFPATYYAIRDDFIGVAIVELFTMSFSRIKGSALILVDHIDSPFLITFIVVSRSEIDLKTIKITYESVMRKSLAGAITEQYCVTNAVYCHGLVNILNPPTNIASSLQVPTPYKNTYSFGKQWSREQRR